MRGRYSYKGFLAMGVAICLFAALGMAVAIVLFAGRSLFPTSPPVPLPSFRGRITQVSVLNTLMHGRYDGVMPIPELLHCGDFGLGTLDHLDGELIVLDGRAYQVRGDGGVVAVGSDRSTPFAIVIPFEPDGEFPCPRVGNLAELDARLDDALEQKNNFLAVRVDGRFAAITLRSVHRQEPPYRRLTDAVKGQSVWTHTEVNGTLVGIRSPAWVGGLNVPGYHWRFLSADRRVGGHVLDCRVRGGRVQYEVCRDWLIKLGDQRSIRPPLGGCQPANEPVLPRRDRANLDRLLRLMQQRLMLMHEVARWKWNAGQPVADAQRERELLHSVVEAGRGKGLDPDLVRSFFAAQMEAARLIQQGDFDSWQANKQEPIADTKSLAVLRQRIDHLNRELIDALVELRPWLWGQTVQQALPQRAEEILTGNDLAGVRETAIAPLRATSP
jgi:acetolactate decarboxylase